MIFTKTAVQEGTVKILSEYQSIRLIRKAEKTSYHVVRCLSNSADASLVDSICYLKQTITDDNKEGCLAMFNNEVNIYEYIEKEIIDYRRYFTRLFDSWYESTTLGDKFTIVTNYEEYGDLQTFLEYVKAQDVQFTEKHIIYMLNNILRAILQLHKNNIIHRDIKPQNIYIDQFFNLKVGGFAVALKTPIGQPAQSSQIVGSYGFMSPEYFQPPYSFEVDVWAIGVIHYFMIYLTYPYGLLKDNYQVVVKKVLKGIENENKHSQKFSKRMKNFMKRFFRPRQQRQTVQTIYEYEFFHSFRLSEIAIQFKTVYQTFISMLNDQFISPKEQYLLQNYNYHNQKVLQVVHYPNWGYFFFLTNLKTLAYFNNKDIRTYPDSFLLPNLNQREWQYRKIMGYVYQQHFQSVRQIIREQNIILTPNMDCSIANLIQCKNTLVIKLQSQCQHLKKQQLRHKKKAKIITVDERYKQFPNLNINQNKLNFDNHTIQIFFIQREQVSASRQLRFITYKSSVILNNSMLKTVKRRQPVQQGKKVSIVQPTKQSQQKSMKRQPKINKKNEVSAYSQESIDISFKKQSGEKSQGNERSKSSVRAQTDKYNLQNKGQFQKQQPSQKMQSIREEEIEPQIIEQNIRSQGKKQQDSHKKEQGGVKKKNLNRRRMNLIKKRTKSLNRYGEFIVKKTGRPNIHIPYKPIQFQKIDVKRSDYYWLVNKQVQPEVNSFVDHPIYQQILFGQITESKEERYRFKKYANEESIYFSDHQHHKNMLNYTKQLLSMMLNRKRQDKEEEPFLKEYMINQY